MQTYFHKNFPQISAIEGKMEIQVDNKQTKTSSESTPYNKK
jgi:hypothetical protein